ncbi:MAG TPA: rhodanese-like domain-containing protein [Rhodanobacteraceae bacterium]|nr:rhodanese-like domain-containing protein [Rhodanobacteraceae bacterium]
MPNAVTLVPAAASDVALRHFESAFAFETDCWDTHDALRQGDPGFVLIDARDPKRYAEGHVPGAVNIPHGKIIASRLRNWPDATLFVVYCAGPHCNGAARAAMRLAALGRPVKLMAGGVTGWLDEGFELERGERHD